MMRGSREGKLSPKSVPQEPDKGVLGMCRVGR